MNFLIRSFNEIVMWAQFYFWCYLWASSLSISTVELFRIFALRVAQGAQPRSRAQDEPKKTIGVVRPIVEGGGWWEGRKKMAGDVEKMIAVGIVWGATNAVMRRGALVWDRKLQLRSRTPGHRPRGRLLGHVLRWIDLLLTWQYSVPFLINLSASAAFFHMLGGAPISVAVPVTNATTFAATAVAAMILGEEMRVGLTFFGTALIVLGVWICIRSGD